MLGLIMRGQWTFGGHMPSSRISVYLLYRACSSVCVGNAWTDAGFDNEGAVDFWWTHALISDEVRDSLLRSCNFSGVGPLQHETLTAASLERNGKLEVICPLTVCSGTVKGADLNASPSWAWYPP